MDKVVCFSTERYEISCKVAVDRSQFSPVVQRAKYLIEDIVHDACRRRKGFHNSSPEGSGGTEEVVMQGLKVIAVEINLRFTVSAKAAGNGFDDGDLEAFRRIVKRNYFEVE